MNDDNRNLLLASALSFLVLIVWFVLFPAPTPQTTEQLETQQELLGDVTDGTPPVAATEAAPAAPLMRDDALAQFDRIEIATPRLTGSLSLTGGRLDDLHLTDYRETLDPESDTVILLNPRGAEQAYFAQHGWAPAGGLPAEQVPGAATQWQVESGDVLTPESPVTLVWDNGAGLIFRKTFSVDEDYMFVVEQEVENTTDAAVSMYPYGIITRLGEPETIGFYILHEGVVRENDGEIAEIDYDDMTDFDFVALERGNVEYVDVENAGWIGFTDKYWMTTLIPEEGGFTTVAKYSDTRQAYQTEVRMPVVSVEAGATADSTTRLFAGAKERELLTRYEEELQIERFVDSIDWGWFWFLTKPIHWLLAVFNGVIGNFGVSIIMLTLFIKALLFPLAYKSYVSMSKMKKLQPQMEAIKEKVGDDREAMQKQMMELYRKEKVNPAAGCLPILAQIPIFFSLYKVLFVAIEMRQAPFFGWIQDLSAPDPTSWMNLFGLLPWGSPDPASLFAILSIGVWPILMGITMWLQQKLNPAPTDPTQAMIFAWLPIVFMFMLGGFAAGLVIYWVANNTITFIQQYLIMRSQGVEVDFLGNIKSTFKRKDGKTAE
ncbi:membrane protein insertase YidC [Pontivivens insulae]|uniref:Membrane protein insertase YidC n=1 Tax=Pontivivens insulae TaxID=1639689 RepID=A0A2R8AEJ8_9RHOB|nr:membrane protein insertase YidC [Pontivivens insulae]RED14373.1 YidC/Oxa1 family membrane protein insertase [Pontivivens insulae]SPF30450.1 Membrane protein insertase YidC [Pontivivens insulae]